MICTLMKIISAIMALVVAAVSGFALPEEKKSDPAFTGSFLQSWASSYWNDDQWESEMEYMKDCGLEYLVIQDLATKSAEENGGEWTVYYDSKLPEFENADRSENDVIANALRHCQKAGIKVFVPLAMFDDFWTEGALTRQYQEICEVSSKMAKELYENYYEGYEDTFYGWYFVPELSNNLLTSIGLRGVTKGLNVVLDTLTEIDSSIPLMLSPFYSRYYSTGPALSLVQLVRFFEMTNFRDGDIYCPQDAVGAGWVEEENLKMVWAIYDKAIATCDADIKLWANVECFTTPYENTLTDGIFSPEYTENTSYIPATFDRVAMQMDIASAYAENIITFSFNHYYSLKYSSSMFMDTYKDYLANGFVLESECPEAVTGFVKTEAENGIELTWNEAEDNFGIAYYRIEKDGKFLTRVETYAGGELYFLDEGASASSEYAITAFDAAGNASETVSV